MSALHLSVLDAALSVKLTWFVGTLSQHDGQHWHAFASVLTHCFNHYHMYHFLPACASV